MNYIKPSTSAIALSLFLLGGCGSSQTTQMQEKTIMTEQSNQADDKAIRAVLARYERALNSSDTEAVMTLAECLDS